MNRSNISWLMILVPVIVGCSSGPPQDLLGPRPLVGQVYRTEWKIIMTNGTITATENGHTDKAHCDLNSQAVEEEEILAVADGLVTKSRIHIVSDDYTISTREGFVRDRKTDRSPLAGETIEFEKVGDDWKKSLVGKTPTAQQAEELHAFAPPVSAAEVYPDQPVKPGYRWNVDVAKYYGRMRNVFEVESGTCTRKFDKMIDWEGEPCAQIAQDLEVRGRMRVGEGQWLNCTMKVSGPIERSTARGISVGCQMKGTLTLSGTITEGGKSSQGTITGPIAIEWKTERK